MNGATGDSDHSVLFATAFYHAAGQSPNAWTLSERAKLDMYYRCMIVCYASLRRLYPSAQLALFTNRELPQPFNGQLQSLQVATEICGARYVSDACFTNGFPGCLLTLDVIEQLASQSSGRFKLLVLLDSDCIARRRMPGMIETLRDTASVYAYEPGYPVTMVANGQSRASLTLALSYRLGRMIERPIPLYGGEFFALSAAVLPVLASRIEAFWCWMKSEGVKTFGSDLTEEHVMSVVLGEPGIRIHGADTLVKRIWTAANFSTIDGNEDDISIWHLPSEKKKGFVALYRAWCERGGFANLDDNEFCRLVDQAVPLHDRRRRSPGWSAYRRLRDTARVLVSGRL
jgi:hypothetical protein